MTCQRAEHVLRLTLREPYALLGGGCTETLLATHITHMVFYSTVVTHISFTYTVLIYTNHFNVNLIVVLNFSISQSQSTVAKTATNLGVPHSEFLMAVEIFCSSLRAVTLSLEHDGQDCLIDLTYAHSWVPDMDSHTSVRRTCGCGLVEDRSNLEKTPLNTDYQTFCPVSLENTQPKILDSFSAKLNALNVAVEVANLVLDVKYIIRDVN